MKKTKLKLERRTLAPLQDRRLAQVVGGHRDGTLDGNGMFTAHGYTCIPHTGECQ